MASFGALLEASLEPSPGPGATLVHVKVHSPFGFLGGEVVKIAVGGLEVKTSTADQLET